MSQKAMVKDVFSRSHRGPYRHVTERFCHLFEVTGDDFLRAVPAKWYANAFQKITKLSHSLNDVDVVDGRTVSVKDGSAILDDSVQHKVRAFKSLVRVFIGSSSVQQSMKMSVMAFRGDASVSWKHGWFSEVSERQPIVVNSLTKISDILRISSQQRKSVRMAICPLVTQHRILTAALDQMLSDLKCELDRLNRWCPSHASRMGLQIVCRCMEFLDETIVSCDDESSSWMRLVPSNNISSTKTPRAWEEFLEMINDLIRCLKSSSEEGMACHINKLDVMKEALSQIKDVQIDKNIGYKDFRHQENLVQKKLTKTLGHSSPCLYTLLCYYLYGCVRDFHVDVRGGFLGQNKGSNFRLYMGRILTSKEEEAVWNGVKQLDKVLGLFMFLWETAGMKGVLELQGHLWCVGSENRVLTYRGNVFFVHGISL